MIPSRGMEYKLLAGTWNMGHADMQRDRLVRIR
jgi:hypothetical protein